MRVNAPAANYERLGQVSREPNHKLALIVARLLSVGPRQFGLPSGRTTKVSDFEQTRAETVCIVPTTSAGPPHRPLPKRRRVRLQPTSRPMLGAFFPCAEAIASRSKRALDRRSANSGSNRIAFSADLILLFRNLFLSFWPRLCKSFRSPGLNSFLESRIDPSCNPDSPSPTGRGSAL